MPAGILCMALSGLFCLAMLAVNALQLAGNRQRLARALGWRPRHAPSCPGGGPERATATILPLRRTALHAAGHGAPALRLAA